MKLLYTSTAYAALFFAVFTNIQLQAEKAPIVINIQLLKNANTQLNMLKHTREQIDVRLEPLSYWHILQAYKWHIVQTLCALCWIVTQSLFWFLEQKLKHTTGWSYWKKELSLEQLFSYPINSF